MRDPIATKLGALCLTSVSMQTAKVKQFDRQEIRFGTQLINILQIPLTRKFNISRN